MNFPTDSFILQLNSHNQCVHCLLIVIIISIIVTTHRDQRTTNEGSYINTLYCIVDNACHLGYWRIIENNHWMDSNSCIFCIFICRYLSIYHGTHVEGSLFY